MVSLTLNGAPLKGDASKVTSHLVAIYMLCTSGFGNPKPHHNHGCS